MLSRKDPGRQIVVGCESNRLGEAFRNYIWNKCELEKDDFHSLLGQNHALVEEAIHSRRGHSTIGVSEVD